MLFGNIISLTSIRTSFVRVSFFATLLLLPSTLFAADLTVSPISGTYKEGQTFTVDVYVTNNTQSINAVSDTLSFPTNLLSVRSLSKNGSIIKLWSEEPSYSNSNGTVKFEGVILNPGFSDTKGKVISVTFQVKQSGTATISLNGGQVLANDGQATNVLGNEGSGSYEITSADAVTVADQTEPAKTQGTLSVRKPNVVSSSYPDQNTWYSSKNAMFSWDISNDVIAVSTLYGDMPDSTPTKVYNPPIKEKSFTVDEDGVQYFHVQFKTKDGWGAVAHYKFQIDTHAPSGLKASFPDSSITSSPKPTLLVTAQDDVSGLANVLISIDGGATTTYPIDSTNLYKLPLVSPGAHTALVSVMDRAGNSSSVSIAYSVVSIDPPKITDYTKYGVKGDVLKVSGTTYPLSTVEVTYSNTKTDENFTESVKSKEDGSFTFLQTKSMPAGVYEMKARVRTRDGAQSDYTDPYVLNLESKPLIRIGMFIMNWLSLVLIVILAGTLVAATLWYSLTQFARFRRNVHRRMKEAENTLKVNVQALRRDTEEFHTLLAKTAKKRELTKEETAIMKKFKKRLDIAEKEIEKKLEEIG